jgi:hypothetical protein
MGLYPESGEPRVRVSRETIVVYKVGPAVVIEARVNQLCVVLEKDDYEDGMRWRGSPGNY